MSSVNKTRIVKTKSGNKWYRDESYIIPMAVQILDKLKIIEDGGDLEKVEKLEADKIEKGEYYQTARLIIGDDIKTERCSVGKYIIDSPNLKPRAIKNLEKSEKFKK